MQIQIRPVLERDAEAISQLLNAIIDTGKFTILEGPISAQAELEFIRDFPERGVFCVAENEAGQVLGFQNVSPASTDWTDAMNHVGVIGTFIAMNAQGQGVGHALSQATFAAARAKGFEKMTAMIRGDNPRAVAFYMGQGFKVVGTFQRHAIVNGNYIDEVLTEKFLT